MAKRSSLKRWLLTSGIVRAVFQELLRCFTHGCNKILPLELKNKSVMIFCGNCDPCRFVKSKGALGDREKYDVYSNAFFCRCIVCDHNARRMPCWQATTFNVSGFSYSTTK